MLERKKKFTCLTTKPREVTEKQQELIRVLSDGLLNEKYIQILIAFILASITG